MPIDLFRKDVNLDYLYPTFLERLLALIGDLNDRGYRYKVYSGYRSFAEQKQLLAAYRAGRGGKAAPPGHSAHNYGLAVDCALQRQDLTLSWAPSDYRPLLDTVEKFQLVSGARYRDMPHINLPNYESSVTLAPLRVIYNSTAGSELVKLKAVWSYLDARI